MARVGCASVFHESNTHVSGATDIDSFGSQWYETDAVLDALAGTNSVVGGFVTGSANWAFDLVPTLACAATPAAPLTHDCFQEIKRALESTIVSQGPLDGFLLELHGAMVAEAVKAADADLVAHVRSLIGPVPLVTVVDPHCNFAPEMLESTDALVAYRQNPHVDMAAAGERAVELLAAMMVDGKHLYTRAVQVPIVAPAIAQATADQPLHALVAQAASYEADRAVGAASVLFGYAYADTPHLGMTAVVVAGTAASAERCALALARSCWTRRREFERTLLEPAEAVALAARGGRLVALADTGDNIGGGAAGNSTLLASHAFATRAQFATTVCDRELVERARGAGLGSTIRIDLGPPSDVVEGLVGGFSDGSFVHRGPVSNGVRFNMGETVLAHAGALRLIIHSRPVMPNDPALFQSAGVDPRSQAGVILKGAAAVRAGWSAVAAEILDVATPGPTTSRLSELEMSHVRRPLWPLDAFDWEPTSHRTRE